METVKLVGRKLALDADGHLKNLNDWDKEVAKEFARLEGINELTDRHWAVIDYMRKEFQEKGDAPSIRKLTKESGVATKELYALFPKGPAKKDANIAGLPKPKGCI